MNWKRFLTRARRAAEFERELDAHLAHEADDLRAAGLDGDAARQAAIRKLGNLGALREIEHERNTFGALDGAWRDLRYAARQIRLAPAYAAVVILSIALGTGANTAIFQLLDALRLRSLPVRDPQRLASLSIPKPRHRDGNFLGFPSEFTNPVWEAIRDRQLGFSGMFAWSMDRFNISPSGQARFAQGLWASGDFFRVLGVDPILGRTFTVADDSRHCGAGAVISYAFWQREFGGAPDVVGRKLYVNTAPIPVIGVMPPAFFGIDAGRRFDVALPLCAERIADGGNGYIDTHTDWWLGVMGRLGPGWTIEQARAQLQSIAPSVYQMTIPAKHDAKFAKDYLALRLTANLAARGDSQLRQAYETPLWLLLGASGLVLALACANLASIAMARASAREREIAVRLAIGASRWRVVRQLFAESLVLAAIGASAGLLLGSAVSSALANSLGAYVFLDLHFDGRVALFTIAIAAASSILFGLAPALRVLRLGQSLAQSAGGRGVIGARHRVTPRRALTIAQIAISLALVTGAVLFIGNLRALTSQNPGFNADGVSIAMLDISGAAIPKPARADYYLRFLDRLESSGAIAAAAEVVVVPIWGGTWSAPLSIDAVNGARLAGGEAYINSVTPGYFRAMGTPLLSGRNFDWRDTLSSPKVAIVNQAFARKYLNGLAPLGSRLLRGDGGDHTGAYEIVGVAADSKYGSLRDNFSPTVYYDAAQSNDADTEAAFVVRGKNGLDPSVDAIKAAGRDTHPEPILELRTLNGTISESLTQERLMARISGVYGLLAAILAAVGVYGALSYLVARRRNEIGIRMALGASRGAVAGMILRETAWFTAIGLALGTGLAIAGTRAATVLIYGISPSDPGLIGGAALGLIAMATIASYLPARRAAAIDPVAALRQE
jgi:predicted permease